MTAELKPWGRFKLVSKEPAEEADHLYFYQSVSKIGRNPTRADIVLDMLFVSGVHCIVMLESVSPTGEATVKIQDMSRNGIYVNEERVGKPNVAQIKSNFTVHFTKPGLLTKNIPPTVYKFEILKSGLTPVNNQLRAERDRASARPPPAGGLATPAKSTNVVTTQQLSGSKHRRSDEDELEIEMTRTISVISDFPTPSPSSSKRRRTGDDNTDLLNTTAQLQKSNQGLRQKLKEASEKEVSLKQTLSLVEREVDTLKDQLDVIEERKKQVEDDLMQKEERLADREREVDRVKEEKESLQSAVEQLKSDLEGARAEAVKQANVNDQLKAERLKLDTEMASMTEQLGTNQAKIRQQDEYIKALLSEKRKMNMAMESAQSRSEQVEEGKRGVHEENILLRTRIKTVANLKKEFEAMVGRLGRAATLEDDQSIIAQELEDLQRHSDNSILSSEQSQPAPAQENYCADTQPEEGDYEQTLDQDAAVAQAGLVRGNIGPFASNLSKIAMDPSITAHLDLDHQQPISTDLSVDDTPAYTDSKSSLESTFSSGSSSKTPPAPPLPRPRAFAPRLELTEEVEETKEEVEETKEEGSDEEKEDGEASDGEEKEKKDATADKDDVDETVLPEEEEPADEEDETALQEDEETALPDEEVEDDKENTPVKAADEAKSTVSTVSTASTTTAKGQPGWLQQIVNGEDKSEQASEGGGIFDDETQLSDG